MNFPPALLALEARAWEEIQAGTLTPDTAEAVWVGVAEYAQEVGVERIVVEEGLKRAVRHGDAAG